MHRGKRGSIGLGLVLLLIGSALAQTTTAEAARNRSREQHVTARLRPTSKVTLVHNKGDKVATLVVSAPPKKLLKRLRKQKGRFVKSVERVGLTNNKLTVKLHLSSPKVRLEHRTLKGPKTLLVSITGFSNQSIPEATKIISQLPELSLESKVPLVLPRIGSRHPCVNVRGSDRTIRLAQGDKRLSNRVMKKLLRRSKRGICRSFVKSLLAENLLRNNSNVEPFERWAFEIRSAPKWKESPYLYQRALLIASYVLLRQKLYPESAALLHSVESMKDRGLIPYVRIAQTQLAMKRNRLDQALKSVRTLTRGTGPASRWQFAAYLAHAAAAYQSQRFSEAYETVLRADKQLSKNKDRGGQLWLMGAESALRLGELKSARALYRRTFQEGTKWHSAMSLMRIGDLLARTEGPRALPKIESDFWKRARSRSRGPALGQLLKLRNLLINSPRFGRDRVREIAGILKNALSDSVRLQAGYALILIRQHRGDYRNATKTARKLIAQFPELAEDIDIRSTQGEVLNAWFKQMARQGDWLDLVNAFKESSPEEIQLLDSVSTNFVASGFNQTGQIDQSVDLMLRILGTNIDEKLREEITIRLWDAYANIGDHFRRGLVERYFVSRYPKSSNAWRFHVREAVEFMKKEKLNRAVRSLKKAAKLAPKGDASQRVRLIKAEVQSLRGNANKASKVLRKELPAIGQSPLELQRVVVNILSECARSCSTKNLELLVKAINDHQDKIQVNERIKFLLNSRSIKLEEPKKAETADPKAAAADEKSESEKKVPSDKEKDATLRDSLKKALPAPADKKEPKETQPKGEQPKAPSPDSSPTTTPSPEKAPTKAADKETKDSNTIWKDLNEAGPDLATKKTRKSRKARKKRRPRKTASGGK